MDNQLVDSVKKLCKKHHIKCMDLCKKESRNGSLKSRILVVTDYRILLISRNPLNIEKIFYLIDLLSLELPDDQKLTISSACKSLTLHTEASFIEPVTEIIRCWVTLFKNFNYETLFTNCSTDVVEQLRERFASKASNTSNYDNSHDVTANGGGFLKMDDVAQFENYSLLYRCMCDYYEVPCLEEVIWDIETIYCLNASKEFDFRDFENLETRYHLPMIAALRNNTWFTSINLSNIKLTQANLIELCKVLKNNVTLINLNLSNTSLKLSHVEKICDALHANKFTLLNSINISKNSLDDKSVQLLCSLSIQWQCLNLAETCIPTGVINTIFGPTNKFQRLTHLDMSKILFKSSGSQVLLLFLSKPNEVETLVLEYTDVPLENLVVSLKGGCVDHLKTLNLCGTQLSRKKMNELHFNSCKTFLSSAQSLRFVNLSHCHLTPDYLKQVLLGIAVNRNMRNVELKLAGNSLDQRFADVFEVSLPMLSNINSLDISNNNFSVDDLKLIFKKLPQTSNLKKLFVGKNLLNNKTRSLEPFVNSLVDYLQDDQATIECLYMEDMSLRGDAYTFINYLGSDVTLLELNIGGNSIGPTGGRLLSKTLQVNNCLQTLMLDKNDFNISALQDIAHGLIRNKTLRNLPLPLHDILAISKNNLERVDKLDAVVKKITSLLQRNNSPTQLLANDQFSKQLLNYDTLDKMVVSMEMHVDRLEGTQQLKDQLNETISTAHQLIQESRLFIEIYKDIYDMVQSAAEPKATTNHNRPHHNDNKMLIEKIKIRSPLDTEEFTEDLNEYFDKVFPKHSELTKLKTRQDTLDPKFLLTNSTLSGIMKRSLDDINHASPFALLSMFKNVAFDMANNVEELMDLMLLKEQECHLSSSPMESSMNNSLRFSTLLGKKKDQVGLNNMTDSLFPDFSMKTLKKARPTSILTDLPDLPVTSSSLEHLNLQRPKMTKKHKITLPVITFSDKKYDVVTKLKESSTFSSLSGSKQSVASSQDTDEEYKN